MKNRPDKHEGKTRIMANHAFQDTWDGTGLAGANADYLEQLYELYLEDPTLVDAHWRQYFDQLPKVNGDRREIGHSQIRDSFRGLAREGRRGGDREGAARSVRRLTRQIRVLQLINAYRFRGHQAAAFNPLAKAWNEPMPALQLESFGLSRDDLETEFDTGSLLPGGRARLKEIIAVLERIYLGPIGAEYMYMPDAEEKQWLQGRLEGQQGMPVYPQETRRWLLEQLTAAEGLERYLHTKYVGQKRFSLEGAEGLIPMLGELVQRGGSQGVREMVIGMAHRGRLNVLVNIMGKPPAELMGEFEGTVQRNGSGSGDVKYHMGYSSNIQTPGGPMHVALAFNPSHLEIVGPVVEGSVRARQERRNDHLGDDVVPVVIHGDAAFAGQGVVMETFNMSQSRGYSTKGTLHIVVNNQIGFTTSNQADARSTLYCTDVAKMVNAPIFHVNGDDPEAVLFVTQLALDFRMTFRKDVVIDLVCYRRHGHNEADEPAATQPMMYQTIRAMPTTRAIYAERLNAESVVSHGEVENMVTDYRDLLEGGSSAVANLLADDDSVYPYANGWKPYKSKVCGMDIETAISAERVRDLGLRMLQVPEDFKFHPTVNKMYEQRRKMALGELPADWGFAENLAYASLLEDGYAVRISGQDCGRGTFFHRHAVVNDQITGEAYVPLRHFSEDQPNFLVINSLLSELAVLAFEYGYATTDPRTLTIWEAQFGDFANGAQMVIDQFISAGEQKWNRMCGLVMMLPHGYEGQGPEHSSARLERFLQLCAEKNMQVCMPSSASQIFHLLRRQMVSGCRKPLVVMTPKSMLRHKAAASPLFKLTEGEFKRLIPDTGELDAGKVTRLLLCSGKVYYDLYDERERRQRDDVAIVRIEQLYPFPRDLLAEELARYPNLQEVFWVQEEPKNQGAWDGTKHYMFDAVGHNILLDYAGRPPSAAPAVGYASLHKQQLHKLLEDAFDKPAKRRH